MDTTTNDIPQGPSLIRALERHFSCHLAIDSGLPLVLAAWSMASHLFERFDCFPYLAITSPTKRCGKTRVAELLELVCARPRRTVGITPAALFRTIEKEKPTLLIDEAESLRSRDERANSLREILNAGYRKGQKVIRCRGGNGGDYDPREFDTYCPKALSLIGALPDTLADRAIQIHMRRRRPNDKIDRFIFARAQRETEGLRSDCRQWAEQNRDKVLRDYEEAELEFLQDREAELWMPLFAVCKIADPSRLAELQTIARRLADRKSEAEAGDLGIKLLADCRTVFEQCGKDRLPTVEFISGLHGLDESPWRYWNTEKGLNARELSRHLRPFGIQPENMRVGEQVLKGYAKNSFQDAWACYLPGEALSIRYNATRAENTGENADLSAATHRACSGAVDEPRRSPSAGCSAVADTAPFPEQNAPTSVET